jgi:hypothetical protein
VNAYQPASKTGLTEVVTSINRAEDESPLDETRLLRSVERWWDDLDVQLKEIAQAAASRSDGRTPPVRSDRELLEEMLNTVRDLARRSSPPRPVRAERRVPDHPAMAELEALLQPFGDVSVLQSMSDPRRIGIRGGNELPPSVQTDVVERGRMHEVDIEFLPRRRIRPLATDVPDDQTSLDDAETKRE